MGKRRGADMPDDWNDVVAWDRYYAAKLAGKKRSKWSDLGYLQGDLLASLADDVLARGGRAAWIPGCGLSPIGRLLAHLGLAVAATDVSPTAVRFQTEADLNVETFLKDAGPPDPRGSFTALVHDLHKKFHRETFDLVVNVKALQGFPTAELPQVARVHADSLKPGGFAYFETMNVQGEARDALEQALEQGGFVVPFSKLNQWYRAALRATGRPHIFILGQPIIPRSDSDAPDGAEWERGMHELRVIGEEYQRRLAAERPAEQARAGGSAKVARVIYSTG